MIASNIIKNQNFLLEKILCIVVNAIINYQLHNNTNLITIPEILIIVLNRGKGIEFKVKLEFSEELNLINYVYFQQTGFMFKLIGVVTHLGESDASGHFIAYSKSPIDDKWYKYNDDLVTKVINFKEEIIDYAMPYILFFQKSN